MVSINSLPARRREQGDYLVTLEILAEGGSGVPAFGWTGERFHLTTDAHSTAHLKVPIVDGFGNPLSVATVSWEQGATAATAEFCGNGTVVNIYSSLNGYAYIDHETRPGDDPLWRPSTQNLPARPKPSGRGQRLQIGSRRRKLYGRCLAGSRLPEIRSFRPTCLTSTGACDDPPGQAPRAPSPVNPQGRG